MNAFHRVNQKGLPIILYGAGLPKVLNLLGEVKSYAERLFKYERIAELTEEEAREAIIRPARALGVSYTKEAVDEILRWSKGYPYFVQELCNTVWENADTEEISLSDVESVISIFLNHLLLHHQSFSSSFLIFSNSCFFLFI